MTSILPEDPYLALGVPKDATNAAIKLAYRKLVLKHHPDKVDEAQKQSAADTFHKIQSAWETIGDEEKRTRYDAQCRLAALRREAADRQPSYRGDVRPPPFRSPHDSRPYAAPPSRGPERTSSYRTEEIRPEDGGYFEKPRSRDYDVYPRRTPPKDDRHRSRLTRQDSKESERARRQEKGRQSTKATARERDHKYSYAHVESDSDTDRYDEPSRRSPREREDQHRARDRYYEHPRRKSDDTTSGRYADDHTNKKFADAKDYIERSQIKRRPSPPRVASRDHTDFVKGPDGRPVAFRRGSGRPRTSARDDVEPPRRPRRDMERSSSEFDDTPKRPPPLAQAKSAPNDIRMPPYDKPRSNSAQIHRGDLPSPIKRADSMPLEQSRRDDGRSRPARSSTLRQSQLNEDIPRAPTYPPPPPTKSPKEYADDYEFPTVDGYRVEAREPLRERRPARSNLPPLRTTSYVYPSPDSHETGSPRPKPSRRESGRKEPLFGSIDHRDREPYSAPLPEHVRYRDYRPESAKVQNGYTASRRPSAVASPNYQRSYSYNNSIPPVSA